MLDDFKKLSIENQNQVLNDLESYSEAELYGQYEEFLDEVYGTVQIAGYTYDTSSALKYLDPTAYRCGFADYLDSREDLIETNGLYFDLRQFDELVEALLGPEKD